MTPEDVAILTTIAVVIYALVVLVLLGRISHYAGQSFEELKRHHAVLEGDREARLAGQPRISAQDDSPPDTTDDE